MADEVAVSLKSELPPTLGARLFSLPLLSRLRFAAARILPSSVTLEAQPRGEASPGVLLTVLSANLWHDIPRQRRQAERLEAFAQLVAAEAADVVLLQEVGRRREFRVDDALAAQLGFAYAYARVNGDVEAQGLEEGVAIFSRYGLADPFLVALSNPRSLWRRLALGVTVRTPWGDLTAVTTHHSLRPWRNRRQPELLRKAVEARAGDHAALVGGDFNAGESTRQIRALSASWIDCFRAAVPDGQAPTHVLSGPLGLFRRSERLDYLFLRPGLPNLVVVQASHAMTEPPFSDHKAVVARFTPG